MSARGSTHTGREYARAARTVSGGGAGGGAGLSKVHVQAAVLSKVHVQAAVLTRPRHAS